MSADVLLGLPVVVLSHRGPVSFTADEGGEREVHRGAGGLVSALTGLAAYLPEAVWVCVAPPGPDAAVAREAAGQLVRLDLGPPTRVLGSAEPAGPGTLSLRLVEVPAQVHEPFYGVIANPLLWFVQHRLYGLALEPALGRAEHAAWEQGYVAANQLVADAVAEQVDRAGGQATVLLHDYHFYLVGTCFASATPGCCTGTDPGAQDVAVLATLLRDRTGPGSCPFRRWLAVLAVLCWVGARDDRFLERARHGHHPAVLRRHHDPDRSQFPAPGAEGLPG